MKRKPGSSSRAKTRPRNRCRLINTEVVNDSDASDSGAAGGGLTDDGSCFLGPRGASPYVHGHGFPSPRAPLPGADVVPRFDRPHRDIAVAGLARARLANDGLHDLVHVIVMHGHSDRPMTAD